MQVERRGQLLVDAAIDRGSEAIVIVAIATVDDVTKKLPLGAAVLYLSGLTAVCAVCYVVFSITTLYYIGYPLLIAYFVFAIKRLSRLPSL